MLARFWRDQDGVMGVFAAGAAAMMVAAGALAVDVSYLYVEQNKLQATVDEVALAAARRATTDPERARNDAIRLVRLNMSIDEDEC